MTPKAYALLALLAVVLASALSQAQAAPPAPRCTFQTLPDGRLQITCPRGLPGPGKGH